MSGTIMILALAKAAMITAIMVSAADRSEPKRVRIEDDERRTGR